MLICLCFDVGCVGGGIGSDRAIQGWQGGLEWRTQTLWGNSPFQIQFHDIASQQTTPHPPTLLPNLQCTQVTSPCYTCTFHNRLIQLHITPAESWVTLSVDPLLSLLLPFFLPLSSIFSSNTLLTLLSLIHVMLQSPNSLSWTLLNCREIPAATGMPCCSSLDEYNTCVLYTHWEQFDWIFPIQEHVQMSWAEWDLISYTFSCFVPHFTKQAQFHEESFQIYHLNQDYIL